jgi:hypothetical protein
VVFTEEDITAVNENRVQYNLTYRRKCLKSNLYILLVDSYFVYIFVPD